MSFKKAADNNKPAVISAGGQQDHGAGDGAKNTAKSPETLFQLFWLMIKSFVLNIPRSFVKQLIKIAVIFIIVLLVHAYLVVVKNEGFTPDGNNKYLSITAFKATYRSAVIFWTFAAFLLSMVISRIGKDGLPAFLKEVGSSPAWLVKCFRMAGNTALYRFMVMTALTILISLFIQNRYTLILYALIVFFSFTSRTKGFLIYVFTLASSDWQRIFNRKGPKTKPNMGMLGLQIFGIFFGFVLAYFIPYKPYGHIGTAILLMAGAIVLLMKRVPPKAVAGFFIFIAGHMIVSKLGFVIADDGGWQEAGGTFGKWIGSPGAWPAVGMGVPPAVGGAIGTIIGSLAGIALPPLPTDEMQTAISGLGINMEGDELNGGETVESDGYSGNGSEVGGSSEAGEGQTPGTDRNEYVPGNPGDGTDAGTDNGEAAGKSDNAQGTGESGEAGDGSEENGAGTEEGNNGEEGKWRFPEGTTSEVNPDGSVTHTLPDGTIVTEHTDGSTSGIKPDGTTATETPDGIYTVVDPDGTVTTEYPDGTIVQKDPDGFTKTLDPDGVQHNSDGSVVTTNPDGSQTVTEPDGTSTTLHPDGRFTTVDEKGVSNTFRSDGSLESRTLPNGATGTYDENYNFTGGTMPDGSPIVANPDGTMSMTVDGLEMNIDPDTGKITGGGTTSDGRTVIFNGDGTIHVKTPDGDEIITNIDKEFLGGKLKLEDGRVVEKDPVTGAMTITAPNGDTATVDQYGNVKFEGYDGTKIESDGKETTITHPDGTSAKVSNSGNGSIVGPEGQSMVKDENGTTYTNPDGSYAHVSADGKTMTGSDGSIAIANPDGSNDVTYPDGTKMHANKDGTGTIVKPNGTTWTGNADGSQTIEKTDGTLLTIDKDKNAVVKYPDGKIETYKPGESLDHLKKIFGT